jgi:hypothetical protein
MIPDEIFRRRIPPTYGSRIPHSEFIDQKDPSFLDLDGYTGHLNSSDPSENSSSYNTNQVEQRIDGDHSVDRHKLESPKLVPRSYVHRIAADPTMIASDIRKYLSSNHVNPLGNSGYFENRRRLSKYSYSF